MQVEAIEHVTPTWRRSRNYYGFENIEVGQIVFFPRVSRMKIAPAACMYGRAHNKKFSCSADMENGVSGMRVTRIE